MSDSHNSDDDDGIYPLDSRHCLTLHCGVLLSGLLTRMDAARKLLNRLREVLKEPLEVSLQ